MSTIQLQNTQDKSVTTITTDEKGLSICTSAALSNSTKKTRGCASCFSKRDSYEELNTSETFAFHVDYRKIVNCYINDKNDITISVLLSEHNNKLVNLSGYSNGLTNDALYTFVQDVRFKSKLKLARRLEVLVNPVGGTGKAVDYYNDTVAPILNASGCIVDMQGGFMH